MLFGRGRQDSDDSEILKNVNNWGGEWAQVTRHPAYGKPMQSWNQYGSIRLMLSIKHTRLPLCRIVSLKAVVAIRLLMRKITYFI